MLGPKRLFVLKVVLQQQGGGRVWELLVKQEDCSFWMDAAGWYSINLKCKRRVQGPVERSHWVTIVGGALGAGQDLPADRATPGNRDSRTLGAWERSQLPQN